MSLTNKEKKVLECLKDYTGTNCLETLFNHIETILNDCHLGHLDILKEDYSIEEKQIISVQNKLNW